MTPRSRTKAKPHRATVYGERVDELLPAIAAICSSGRVLKAGSDSGHERDMLTLSLTLPPSAGGSVRRALLRSQAEILRRQADAVGAHAPADACVHCHESEAMRDVLEQLQRVAHAFGICGTTIAERALLLGQLTAAAPCRCRAVG